MRLDLLLEALPIAGVGFAGVFLVTGVLIGAVALLNRVTGKKSYSTSFLFCELLDKFLFIELITQQKRRIVK